MSEDRRAYKAAAQAMAQTGTADLDTLARAAVDDAAPIIRGNERNQCIALAEAVGATYPAERDPAPEQRRASTRPGLDAAFRYPFSEYLEDTYDGGDQGIGGPLSESTGRAIYEAWAFITGSGLGWANEPEPERQKWLSIAETVLPDLTVKVRRSAPVGR